MWRRTCREPIPVPDALRWWGRSKAARPRCSRRCWRGPERSSAWGRWTPGPSVGDASKEAREHHMSVEMSAATTTFMDESYTFIDCPGSIEFIHDMRAALPAVDAAVVVCEADEKKVPQLQLLLRELEDREHPALSVPQQDRQSRHPRRPTSSRCCSRRRECRCCCAKFRCGRARSLSVSSISRWNAPTSIASTRPPRSFRSRATRSTARKRRASPCWRRLPIMTTS